MRVAVRNSKSDEVVTPPFRSVAFLLSSLGFAVSRHFHEVLAPLELEPGEFALLRAVSASGGEPQNALAERLHISPAGWSRSSTSSNGASCSSAALTHATAACAIST